MASITSWVRLEPRSRDRDMTAGTEARIADPLWLLGRQYQVGELLGVDGGSAITARTRYAAGRADALRAGDPAWRPFDPDSAPLEIALATSFPTVADRVRAGRQLQRALATFSASERALTSRFAFEFSPDELAALTPEDHALYKAAVGRVPDAARITETLAPMLEGADLPAELAIAPDDPSGVETIYRKWLASRRLASPGTWRPDQLAYRFEVRVGGARLVANGHRGGALAWHAFDAASEPGSTPPTEEVSTKVPSHVHYRGAPARRYWDLEDTTVRWPSFAASPGDPARLVMIELGLTFADHWLIVPLELQVGSVARITSMVVTDTFGVRTLVRSAEELDGPHTPWRFLELDRDPLLAGPLVLALPAASSPLVGPPLTTVDLVRDDVSDTLWAVDVPATAATVDAAPPHALPVYQLGTSIPATYHPYRARIGVAGLELARAVVAGEPLIVRPDLPERVAIGAVPERPVRSSIVPSVVRGCNGSYHLVLRHELASSEASPLPVLRFDVVTP